MPNPRGPYVLKFPIVVSGFGHEISFNVLSDEVFLPGSDPADVEIEAKGDSDVALDDAANSIWGVIRAGYAIATLASTYELWRANPLNDDLQFVSAGILTTPNGANPGANSIGNQAILTWRSAKGSIAKMVLPEAAFVNVSQVPLPSTGLPWVDAINAYVMSSTNVIAARDRSFPVAPLNASFGPNRALFKRRNRS